MCLDRRMTTTTYPSHDELVSEARGWIADCFEDAPDDLTDTEVMQAIARHYAGGIDQFCKDSA